MPYTKQYLVDYIDAAATQIQSLKMQKSNQHLDSLIHELELEIMKLSKFLQVEE
ncbi:hypothetical protein HK099_008026 [Clydaea vesicula]|uniref:Uncharacterized protein n=1 Tax=Clydaea vesicula TaxID=447962 RepID=A0AAD5U983_9FUNG|nr:hypothetical protein HK099_008026 [Clydaea vesicula]KAJ3394356.1 hypothetical protein HDU92_006935 [Lobulomyces angularis]